jgi:hypothetical protein
MGRSIPHLPQSAYLACCGTALCFCFHFVPIIDCWLMYTAWLHCDSVWDDISKLNSLNLLKPNVTYHLLEQSETLDLAHLVHVHVLYDLSHKQHVFH